MASSAPTTPSSQSMPYGELLPTSPSAVSTVRCDASRRAPSLRSITGRGAQKAAAHTLHSSACATVEVLVVARQHAVRVHNRSSVDGHGTGEVTNQAWRPSGMSSPSSHARAACWPKFAGENERAWVRVGASEHGWMGGAMCIPRGRGRPYRTVAMSLAREDYTRAPRWRARARIVLFSRERPVSRFGQKKEKSTTCEPSTLRRSAWSRPPRRQRSASTSLPRRPRTPHWK